jgi:NAD(P)-dependent dehydrogenase (short-subunit alcohol dehydrogenase family)
MESPIFDTNVRTPPFSLQERTAIVFGAGCVGDGWGNGNAAAVAYARAGARVACVDLDPGRAEATTATIRSEGGEAIALQADVASSAEVASAVRATMSRFGRIDILHNNPAIAPFGDPVTLSEETWDLCFAVNVKSVFLTCKHILPAMKQQRRGVITNISSLLSLRISDYDLLAYSASKAALDQATKAVAVKFARYGIRCNAVLPGLINSPQIREHRGIVGQHGSLEETMKHRDAMSPSGRQGSPWDIAWASVFLATDAANYINGVCLLVDAGLANRQATRPLEIAG